MWLIQPRQGMWAPATRTQRRCRDPNGTKGQLKSKEVQGREIGGAGSWGSSEAEASGGRK